MQKVEFSYAENYTEELRDSLSLFSYVWQTLPALLFRYWYLLFEGYQCGRHEIDKILAKHYGFTEEELAFIPSTWLRTGINYDVKYRMGMALFGVIVHRRKKIRQDNPPEADRQDNQDELRYLLSC